MAELAGIEWPGYLPEPPAIVPAAISRRYYRAVTCNGATGSDRVGIDQDSIDPQNLNDHGACRFVLRVRV